MINSLDQLDFNKTYSYADYLKWQFDERVELIKGKIFKMSPAPARRHQRISGLVFAKLYNFLDNKPVRYMQHHLMFVLHHAKVISRQKFIQ